MITSGNREEEMLNGGDTGFTAERFVEAMLELIIEQGGSVNVNLRQISRRLGCAHTNAYNYFASYDDLRWAAFRRALGIYGEYLVSDVDDSMTPRQYLHRVIAALATFPEQHPGICRFIASDPIDLERLPPDILMSAADMKRWLSEVFLIASGPRADQIEAEEASNIVLAYIDGETLNLINGRVVPGEDVRGRIVDNALRLFDLLTAGIPGEPVPGAGDTSSYQYPDMPLPRGES